MEAAKKIVKTESQEPVMVKTNWNLLLGAAFLAAEAPPPK